MALPSGTVTFLFTDVEGSTRLWERHGEAMRTLQERHDALVTGSVTSHDGKVVKTMGDGVMAVFSDADSAVAAAVAAQVAISSADWSPLPELRVRMGLHTGSVVPCLGDYLGAAVNRAARVADAANGGQVLASHATAVLLSRRGELGVRSLGQHRLRDLSEPIELVQITAKGLPDVTLPPRTLEAIDHNLPAPRSSFVGRVSELEAVSSRVMAHRLLTLTGLGGAGKTRLALRVAGELSLAFPDGVRLVELAPASGPQPVLDAVAGVLALPADTSSLEKRVASYLYDRAMLLVVDNCEHLLAEAARVVDTLLARCPKLHVLATSREPLGSPGEHVWTVQPLALDDPRDAVELFMERAVAARADFEVTPHNQEHAVRICRQVDGLPLAIELAAARVTHLSPAEIGDRLEEHLALLSSTAPVTSERHRTLSTALEWSYGLLTSCEQAVFRRMAVFVAPADLQAVEEVCGNDGVPTEVILDIVGSLVAKNLVIATDTRGGTRYHLLHTVRRYALECFEDKDEVATVRRHHATRCVRLLDGADFLNLDETARTEALAALAWAIDTGEAELAGNLAAGAWRVWELAGQPREGRTVVEQALALVDESSPATSALLSAIAHLAFAARDFAAARRFHERNLALLRSQGSALEAAFVLTALATADLFDGDPVSASSRASEAVRIFGELGDSAGLGFALSGLAMIDRAAGHHERAQAHLLESLRLLRIAGRKREAANVLTNLGNLAADSGETGRAHRYYEGALQLQRETDDRRGAALSLNNLSILARDRRDLDRAVEFADEALQMFREVGDRPGEAACLNNLANLAHEQGDPGQAFGLYCQAADGFRSVNDRASLATTLTNLADVGRFCNELRLAWSSLVEAARIHLERNEHVAVAGFLSQLAEIADAGGVADGAAELRRANGADATSLRELVELAAAMKLPDVTRPPVRATEELTARERQVAGLVARGLANREIASQLFVSERTVDSHITHIRTKLGLNSRTKLARWALEHGLDG